MSRMKTDYTFVSGVHMGGDLYFNTYNLAVDLYTNTESISDQNIALKRMHYFISSILQKGIFVHEDDTKTIKKYHRADILVFTTPDPPQDPIVQAVITHKLNSIMEDALVITETEVTSSCDGMTYIWDSSDEEDDIHESVTEEDENWWNDSSPNWFLIPEGSETVAMDWDRIDLSWASEEEEFPTSSPDDGEEIGIVKAKFK